MHPTTYYPSSLAGVHILVRFSQGNNFTPAPIASRDVESWAVETKNVIGIRRQFAIMGPLRTGPALDQDSVQPVPVRTRASLLV